jgi:hypothetical protein
MNMLGVPKYTVNKGVIHYESHPAPPPITRRAVCMVRVQRSMVRLTIGP